MKNNNIKGYSIISAVYNVEKYLNKYFKSIINQSLDFKKNIYIILVDDGSTDNSATIIKKWQRKYPDNILYIKKANGGQSSARNLGLDNLSTPWVTFIDPDDFVDKRYFEEVDRFISQNKSIDLSMVGTALHFYFDRYRINLNMHPLKYRFKDNKKIFKAKDLKNNMQLSASSAFFRSDLIANSKLRFDERVKPNFEDAHFVNIYLIANYQSSVSFLKYAKYNYRKRSVGNSTIDGAWSKKEMYNDVLYFGCLDLLKRADIKLGYVPKYLQRTILYHLSWYYKYIINNSNKLSFLSQNDIDNFEALLMEIFTYIDCETINQFELVVDDYVKLAWLYIYKQTEMDSKKIYVYREKSIYKFYYYDFNQQDFNLKIDDKHIETPTIFEQKLTFLDKKFINKYSFEIESKDVKNSIIIEFNNKYYTKIDTKDIKGLTIINIKRKIKDIARKLLLG